MIPTYETIVSHLNEAYGQELAYYREKLKERMIRYAQINTRAHADASTVPSSPGQRQLAELLKAELIEIGLSSVTIDENGYLMATLPAHPQAREDVPVIGFLAHLDTATEMTADRVRPQVVEQYQGGDIVLNALTRPADDTTAPHPAPVILSPNDFPNLLQYKGHTLITTDGTTLLGADDKAGIAEIVTACEYLLRHPHIVHGTLRLAFTPDEEIGRGPHHFDVGAFQATYAYTVDGGPIGELQYESFNAAQATITIYGKNIHPGTAKGKMVHATQLALAFHAALPEMERPEYTEGYEGFYHLLHLEGDVEKATLQYIIRDFDRERFENRKKTLEAIAQDLRLKEPRARIDVAIRDQYYNMKDKIEPHCHIVTIAERAYESLGITPRIQPIRGGTDGSQLSYMGLPTPNIFAGGENFHGRFEYVSLESMLLATMVIVRIAEMFSHHSTNHAASKPST